MKEIDSNVKKCLFIIMAGDVISPKTRMCLPAVSFLLPSNNSDSG